MVHTGAHSFPQADRITAISATELLTGDTPLADL